MTRNGKIARLPRAIREQVNRKLDDGITGVEIVEWLNTLPEAQTLMAAEFDGRPIREQNLSEWKAGGYRDWQMRQEALEMVRSLAEEAGDLKKAAEEEPLTEALALWVASRYAVAAKKLAAEGLDGEAHWKLLRAFCSDIVALRQGDHSAENLKIERKRLELEEKEYELKLRNKAELGLAAVGDEIRGHRDIRALFEPFRVAYLKEFPDEAA